MEFSCPAKSNCPMENPLLFLLCPFSVCILAPPGGEPKTQRISQGICTYWRHATALLRKTTHSPYSMWAYMYAILLVICWHYELQAESLTGRSTEKSVTVVIEPVPAERHEDHTILKLFSLYVFQHVGIGNNVGIECRCYSGGNFCSRDSYPYSASLLADKFL